MYYSNTISSNREFEKFVFEKPAELMEYCSTQIFCDGNRRTHNSERTSG